MLVDDGSHDDTWKIIEKICASDRYIGIKLSHNCGHQNAVFAGMMYAKDNCDCVVTIDADLQDDLEVMDEMISDYQNGCEIVYGARKSRKTDSHVKRFTAESYYRLLNYLGIDTIFNHADYRLMSRKALNALASFGERNLYLRGIVPKIGMKSSVVYYKRKKRTAGKSNYSVKKMIQLAENGIFAFSKKPIHLIICVGAVAELLSIAAAMVLIIQSLVYNEYTQMSFLLLSVYFVGGAVLLGIGIIGEYIGMALSEIQKRPRYIIEEIIKDTTRVENDKWIAD